MLKRTEESHITSWYFEIDRRLLFAVLVLTLIGIWAAVTAGSVAAERMNPPQSWHYFLFKMIPFYIAGLGILFAGSMMNKKWVMGIAWLNIVVGLALLAMTFIRPSILNQSARWVSLFGFRVMPADIMKPGFIIITAWFLDRLASLSAGENIFTSRRAWRWDGWPAYLALFIPALFIIFKHPDVGTAALYFILFSAMLFLAGLPWLFVAGLGALASLGGIIAFFTVSHFHKRVLLWLGFEGGADNYQITKSVEAIRNGGLFGSGEDAFIKQSLPDAHTDFIYSAIAEDSGALLAVCLIFGLLFVLKRLADNARGARDRFVLYVAGGVFALFGVQVSINIASALGLIPTKGMTLPFISYGGSSFLSFCLLFGLLIALIREDRWK
ncbi:MAG: FtsW/RodA/SpoVE family cell cycle protein [Alphaproteobacteria bacterium]|nr:FtsW/RodA/SpoVE family cell cycle protein [Alphaproteobacteria bacterium]